MDGASMAVFRQAGGPAADVQDASSAWNVGMC